MEITTDVYNKYKKILYKQTHRFAAKYHMDFDDLIGDAMEIFVIAAKNYDEEKGATFSTYLFYQLKALEDRAKAWLGRINERDTLILSSNDETLSDAQKPFIDIVGAIDFSIIHIELVDSIASDLSSIARIYLKDLFAGEFAEVKKAHCPTIFPRNVLAKRYGVSTYAIEKMREEIKSWWSSFIKDTPFEYKVVMCL